MIGLTNFNFFLFLNHLNGWKTIKFSDTKVIEIDINGPRFRVFEDKLKKIYVLYPVKMKKLAF